VLVSVGPGKEEPEDSQSFRTPLAVGNHAWDASREPKNEISVAAWVGLWELVIKGSAYQGRAISSSIFHPSSRALSERKRDARRGSRALAPTRRVLRQALATTPGGAIARRVFASLPNLPEHSRGRKALSIGDC
jgi:hypothetical protein